MGQQSTKGWGGKREGSGAKPGTPLGTGDQKSVALRVGEDLLELLRQRWPDLKNDSERIRAAMWEAVGKQPS